MALFQLNQALGVDREGLKNVAQGMLVGASEKFPGRTWIMPERCLGLSPIQKERCVVW